MTSPPLAQEMPDGSRRYVHPVTAEAVPSVTTVIDQLAKPKLPNWAARMAAEYAVSQWDFLSALPAPQRIALIKEAHEVSRNKSASLGTRVHGICDSWSSGRPSETSKETDPYLNQFTGFLMRHRPRYIETEVTLWSRKYSYAGTADAICEIEGKIVLLDYKTGRSVYPEVGLQTSALAHCDFIIREDGTEEPVPDIGKLGVLHVRPRGCKLVYLNHGEENFKAFLAARELFDWTNYISSAVLQEAA